MSNNLLSPKETADALLLSAQTKASMPWRKRALLSIMAGLFIALGGQGFVTTYENVFLRAAVFPVGLMLIVLVGGELFTGNCLMTFGFLQKKFSLKQYASSLTQVFIGNFIGSLIVVALVYFGGIYKNQAFCEAIIKISQSKMSLTFTQSLCKGILCNILVALGVWFATTSKDTTGKLLGCWFPVMLFVLCGYEHCVANMFFLPLGAILDPSITIGKILFTNLLPVTIGNFIGGGILVPFVYNSVYYKYNL